MLGLTEGPGLGELLLLVEVDLSLLTAKDGICERGVWWVVRGKKRRGVCDGIKD